MPYFQYFFILSCILLLKAALILLFILNGNVGLGPDEAQYWTWSQSLDWGYYSKPPGIAWQIAFGTLFFGNSELGVRFGSILIGTALSMAVFCLAKACRLQASTAFWAGIVMAFTPLGVMSSFLAITDGGVVLFWTLATIFLVSAKPNMFVIGILIFCGALFKWQIYYFWIFVALSINYLPSVRKREILGGMAISLMGLVPSLIWNVQHQWVTFRHVAGNIGVENRSLLQGNFWAFFGEQAALLSPILFGILLMAFIYFIRKSKEISWPIWFCGMSSMLIIVIHCFLALFKKMQGNWCDYAYPTAIVFLCWYACEKVSWGKLWLKIGLVLSIGLCILSLSIPYLPVSYRINPFKHNLGWKVLSNTLTQVGYDPNAHFLFSDKYQMSSLLSFYSKGQKRAYFLNLHHIRNNQFSFWPSMAMQQRGNTGFFVISENTPHKEKNFPVLVQEYQDLLQNYFKEVHYLGEYPLFYSGGKVVKAALIYKCVDYNGEHPSPTNLY